MNILLRLSLILLSILPLPLKGQNLLFNLTEYHFGYTVKGELIEAEFTFENTTQRDLIIGQIQTSCGCTAVEWPREVIAPGEKNSLKVRYDTGLEKQIGEIRKVIIVLYNYTDGEPEQTRETKLVLTGELAY